MKFWETPEYVAARREDSALFAAWCQTVDYRNLPPRGTPEYVAYHRDVVDPAKAAWWVARQRLNALRVAGQAGKAVA